VESVKCARCNVPLNGREARHGVSNEGGPRYYHAARACTDAAMTLWRRRGGTIAYFPEGTAHKQNRKAVK
jgi:hypothetical protein